MQFFDECLAQRLPCVGDHIVNAAEMVDGFDNIIDIDDLFFKTDRIGLEDISCLIMRELAAFHVIGVIGQFDLDFMIDTAFSVAPHLVPQNFKQCMRLFQTTSARLCCICRYMPGFADQHCTGNSSFRAVVADRSLRNAPFFCNFGRFQHIHMITSCLYDTTLSAKCQWKSKPIFADKYVITHSECPSGSRRSSPNPRQGGSDMPSRLCGRRSGERSPHRSERRRPAGASLRST